MQPRHPAFTWLFKFQKYIAIICILIGTLIMIGDIHKDLCLILGLNLLFIAPEKREDERSASLKMSSLYGSFLICFVINFISTSFKLPYQFREVNHFLIMVFSLSILIYYIRLYSHRS